MRAIYFFLVFILAIVVPQAYALDLGETLKNVVKESTAGKTTSTANSESKKAFNWESPSQQEEIQIGREITGNLLGAAPLVKDAALQKYVNQVGRWVANQSERGILALSKAKISMPLPRPAVMSSSPKDSIENWRMKLSLPEFWRMKSLTLLKVITSRFCKNLNCWIWARVCWANKSAKIIR
jgi:hypothetical protein